MLWRPEGTTLSKPRAEARRALRALAQPWVAYVVHTESQRDGPNPTRIVRPIPDPMSPADFAELILK